MAEITNESGAPFPLPRVTIKFCTQCKWLLRAAYYAQELLSTFSTSLGEVALQPSTGGTFVVEIFHADPSSPSASAAQGRVLWDRKADGGFPETKELKRRVRDVIEPERDLGHVDRHGSSSKAGGGGGEGSTTATAAPSTSTASGEQKERPSRTELEAAGQAGGGYPGSSEAAAQLVGDLQGQAGASKEACEGKEVCEDCN